MLAMLLVGLARQPAGAQTTSVPVTANVATPIATQFTVRPDQQPRFECQPTSPVRTQVTFEGIVPSAGKYVVQNLVVQWINAVSAVQVDIPCTIRDSTSSADITLQLQPVLLSAAAVTLRPAGAKVGAGVNVQVRVKAAVGNRALPFAGVKVRVELPDGYFTGEEMTHEDGIASFATHALGSVSVGKDTAAEVSLDAATRFRVPFAVNPPALDSVRVPPVYAAVAGDVFDVPMYGYGAGTLVCDQDAVTIVRASGTGRLKQHNVVSSTYTAACKNHLLVIDDITYEGALDDYVLDVTVKGVTKSIKITPRTGAASSLRFVQEPPRFFVASADSNMLPAPKVRLTDRFGNPVASHSIAAHLVCATMECDGYLAGTALVATNAEGIADFVGMRFVGRQGDYTLCFQDVTNEGFAPCTWRPLDLAGVREIPSLSWKANYNVDREYNKNFVIISAIHSIAGHRPASEFFDIRFRFRLPAGFSASVAADLNIERASTSEAASDTAKNTREVTDAFAMVNWSGRPSWRFWLNAMRVTDARTDALDRLLVLGAQVRIFSGVPYVGLHAGAVEMGHSTFFGSSLTLGLLRPLSYLPVKLADEVPIYPVRNNLVAEGFLRSSAVDFFKFLNVRATFLIPFETARRIQSRIAIAVPIGGITAF